MKSIIAQVILSQMLASLSTLRDCIDRCPNSEWEEPHNDYPFCQVVFHALFDCDLVLSEDVGELRGQEFHAAHRADFGEYEELDGKSLVAMHKRDLLIDYYAHCREKVKSVLGEMSDEKLIAPNADFYRNMTRCERYVNGIRHLQHHAAQLGFRLQLITGKEMNWVSRENG